MIRTGHGWPGMFIDVKRSGDIRFPAGVNRLCCVAQPSTFVGWEHREAGRRRPPGSGVEFTVSIVGIQAAALELGDHLRAEQQNKCRGLETQQHDYRRRQ